MLSSHAVRASVAAGALALALSACGSSSSNTTGSASASSSSSRYQAQLNFAKCMRSHGVNVPDPSSNGGPPAGGGLQQLRSSPNFQPALNACQKQLGQAFGFANLTAAQRAQFQQAAVKFAQCMRSHNVNIPDPTGGGAGGPGIFQNITPTERNSPAFQTAFTACRSSLPQRPGGGGPGGAPGGAPGA
jgi:hypothetical protein